MCVCVSVREREVGEGGGEGADAWTVCHTVLQGCLPVVQVIQKPDHSANIVCMASESVHVVYMGSES